MVTYVGYLGSITPTGGAGLKDLDLFCDGASEVDVGRTRASLAWIRNSSCKKKKFAYF